MPVASEVLLKYFVKSAYSVLCGSELNGLILHNFCNKNGGESEFWVFPHCDSVMITILLQNTCDTKENSVSASTWLGEIMQ